jgi:hypothetical protein
MSIQPETYMDAPTISTLNAGDNTYGSGANGITILEDVLTTPNGITLNSVGISYDSGTTITSTSWDDITTRISYLSAIAPNNLNPTLLAVNNNLFIENADTNPTRVISIQAGDTSQPSEHFGIQFVGDTLPFVMETLDATPLQVKDTPLKLTSSTTGGSANPILTLTNTTNDNSSITLEVFRDKGAVPTNGDVLFQQSVYGEDSFLNKQEYTRITHTIRDGTGGIEDGSIEMGCVVNGSFNNFLQLNGNQNEVNCLKTLDMGGNTIRTSTGNITIDATASAGNILMSGSTLQFNTINIIPRQTYSTFAFSVLGSPTSTILNFGVLNDMTAGTNWKVDVGFYTGDGMNNRAILTYVVTDTLNAYSETNSAFGYTQGGLQTPITYDPAGTPMGKYCSFTDTFLVSPFATGDCSFILTGGTSDGSIWAGTCRVSIVLTRIS